MGLPQFAQRGTRASGEQVSVVSRPELQLVTPTQTDTVAIDEREDVEVYAPTGSIYSALSAYAQVDPVSAATSGNHRMQFGSFGAATTLTRGTSSYNTAIAWNTHNWDTADANQDPTETVAQGNALEQLKATENSAMGLTYVNTTDAEQTAQRTYKFVIEEVTY